MLDISKFQASLQQSQSKSGGGDGGTPVVDRKFGIAYLPEGMHTVRILADKNSAIGCKQVFFHNIPSPNNPTKFIKVECADQTKNSRKYADCPLCKRITELEESGSGVQLAYNKFTRQSQGKLLMYVVDTNNPSEWWSNGNFYVVLMGKKAYDAITAVVNLESTNAVNAGHPEFLETFDYAKDETIALQLNVTRGAGGSVIAQFNQYNKPKLELASRITEEDLPDINQVYLDKAGPGERGSMLVTAVNDLNRYAAGQELNTMNNQVAPQPEVSHAQAQPQVAPAAPVQPQVAPQTPVQPVTQQLGGGATVSPQPSVGQPEPAAAPTDTMSAGQKLPDCYGNFVATNPTCLICPKPVKFQCQSVGNQ